jgi:GTPase SAR1 family protein
MLTDIQITTTCQNGTSQVDMPKLLRLFSNKLTRPILDRRHLFSDKRIAKMLSNVTISIVILGLSNAGKTTIWNIIRRSIEEYRALNKNYYCMSNLSIIDLPKSPFSHDHLKECNEYNAIIFVVDCTDRNACNISRDELHNFLGKNKKVNLLVFANKRDRKMAMTKKK